MQRKTENVNVTAAKVLWFVSVGRGSGVGRGIPGRRPVVRRKRSRGATCLVRDRRLITATMYGMRQWERIPSFHSTNGVAIGENGCCWC